MRMRRCTSQGIKDPDSKRKLWPILLGVLAPGMSDQARHEALDAYQGSYDQVGGIMACTTVPVLHRLSPVDSDGGDT